MKLDPSTIAAGIDHTLLKPDAGITDVDRLCDEALQYGFATVCVNPVHVGRAAMRLATSSARGEGTLPHVGTVIGFPLGATRTETKLDEAKRAIDDGAVELDMVVRIDALIAGHNGVVRQDIEALAHLLHGRVSRGILKVILETALLPDDRIILGCRCCAEAEADYVKTSTGFHSAGGASVEHVRLLHKTASPLKVKASGGIRHLAQARDMLAAGASRIGTSAGVAIVMEAQRAAKAL